MHHVPATVSRQLKFGKTLRVSLTWNVRGRPKGFLSKRVRFSAVVEEDGGVPGRCDQRSPRWEWSAEQITEIRQELVSSGISADFEERGARSAQSGVHFAHFAADAHSNQLPSRDMRLMTLSPTRGRTRWEHGEGCRNDTTR